MNKLFFGLLFFICLTESASAQISEDADYDLWYFQQDSPVYVFSNKAYLRSGPDVTNEIVDSLSTGTKLIFKEATKAREIFKRIFAPWIKVATEDNKEGYVWAGALAFATIGSKDMQFFCGIDRASKWKTKGREDQIKYVIQLKGVRNNSLINLTEWNINADESAKYTEIKLLGDVKLTNLLDVVRISFGGEACGIPMNYYYYGWTGKEFLELPTKYSVGDAGVFYHSETLLFPNEPGGQPNKIIKLVDEEEILEEATETTKEKSKKSYSRDIYVWDGQKAILQKNTPKKIQQ